MNQEAPKSARRPLLVAVGAVAVLALVLAVLLVVGSAEEPAPTEARPRPELGPLALSERVWAADGVTLLRNGGTVRVRDGRLLVGTKDGIQLLDVESGAVLWAQDDEADLPGQTVALDPSASQQLPFLVRHGDGVGVLVGYNVFRCDPVEPGVALLSGEAGGVVWQAPTTPAEGCARNKVGWKQQLWAADDTTALVSVAPNLGSPDDLGQVRVLALDVATGQRRWEYQGAWPYAVAGGVALVSTDKPIPATHFTEPGMVTALDLATGQPRWSLADRYPVAHPVHAAGDMVVVVTSDKPGGERGRAGTGPRHRARGRDAPRSGPSVLRGRRDARGVPDGPADARATTRDVPAGGPGGDDCAGRGAHVIAFGRPGPDLGGEHPAAAVDPHGRPDWKRDRRKAAG